MTDCFFVSDLHGNVEKYIKLFEFVKNKMPKILFMGGDLLPSGSGILSKPVNNIDHFVNDFLIVEFEKLKKQLTNEYPDIYLILGNDDARIEEVDFVEAEQKGIWHYASMKRFGYGDFTIIGYPYVPPTPFQLKDWEKYDVSRYIDPGCISPEEGRRTIAIEEHEIKYSTIEKDLTELTKDLSFDKLIFLFHSPPYKTDLDRAALDGKMIDHIPLDVNVGSIAIKRIIEKNQPWITMHGHVHESARLTGNWAENINNTFSFNAAHDGPELSLIIFQLENPSEANRILI